MEEKKNAALTLLPVVKVSVLAACAAVLLACIDARMAIVPLAVFVLVYCAAPFFPQWGFFLPVICRGPAGSNAVALTFDDGPDPATTPGLLQLLAEHNIQATFFVIGAKARRYPELMQSIITRGHAVGNHSLSHDELLMLRSSQRLYTEVAEAQKILEQFGITARAFRPPAGITNPRLGKILRRLGLRCITFSCRAFDGGNRHVERLAGKILKKVKPGDIILLHDVQPTHNATPEDLLREIEKIITGLRARQLSIVPLSELVEA